MDKLVEYTKYTLALAVGLFFYIPANFIPNDVVWLFWLLMAILAMLVGSIACGILLYSRATTLLVEDKDAKEDAKGWTKLWGTFHLALLLVAFFALTPYYFWFKVWMPTAKVECHISIPAANGTKVEMSFPCKADLTP